MPRTYELPTSWTDKNDYAETTSYNQFGYDCEIGIVNAQDTAQASSTHTAINVGHSKYPSLLAQIKRQENAVDRRVAWFKLHQGSLKHTDESFNKWFNWLMSTYEGNHAGRYDSLLLDFVNLDWTNDSDVIQFYLKYGPLWLEKLRKTDLEKTERHMNEDGCELEEVCAKGEWLHAVEMQASGIKLLLDLQDASRKLVIEDEQPSDRAVEYSKFLLKRIIDVYPSKRTKDVSWWYTVSIPKPAAYAEWWDIHIPDPDLLNHSQLLFSSLDAIVFDSINKGLEGVEIKLEQLTKCPHSSPNFKAPLLVNKPRNLMQLIYIKLAAHYTSRRDHPQYCPACDKRFHKTRAGAVWHSNKCRMKIERKIGSRGAGLSPREKSGLYLSLVRGL